MPGKLVKVGPFKGGLNNVGETTTIDDAQLAAVNNFDVDNDGSLLSRPAIVFEADSPSVIPQPDINFNYIANPSFETDLSSTSSFTGSSSTWTLSRQGPFGAGSGVPQGSYFMRATTNGAAGGGPRIGPNPGIGPNAQYSFTVYVRSSRAVSVALVVEWNSTTAGISSTSGPNVALQAGVWTPLTLTAVSPANSATFVLDVYSVGSPYVNGDTVDLDAASAVNGGTPMYFDGSFAPTGDASYAWTGTAGASQSRMIDTRQRNHFTTFGYFVAPTGITFLVGVCGDGTYVYNLNTHAFTRIWTGIASDFCQYDNNIVLCSETGPGGYYSYSANSFTATSSMPAMSQIVVYGERFWGYGPQSGASTTVYFSNLTVISPAQSIYDWQPTSNFFNVGKGDGQWITAIVSDPNALLIFRSGSTYQFTYPTSPITGTLRKLNPSIGADNKRSVVAYENYYLVLNGGFLYQFINYLYYSRNVNTVKFAGAGLATVTTVTVSIFGQRAIVYYFGAMYVYDLVQGIWTTWSNTYAAMRFLQLPASSSTGSARVALVEGGLTATDRQSQSLRRITDTVIAAQAGLEVFTCYVKTKTYVFDDPGIFKRMMYWAVSFKSASGLVAMVTPNDIVSGSTTWNDMNLTTWNTLNLATWNNPTIKTPTITDNIPFPQPAPVQALAKVQSRIRFKGVYFEVTLQSDGTATTAPTRVFSITAYLKEHMRTRDKVS